MRYRRANVPGATYFFTVNLAERRTGGLLVEHIDSLRGALRRVKRAHPFRIDAMVVLPDHLHALWTLPRDDADFATRWMLITFSLGEVMRYSPAGIRTSSTVKAKGTVTVAEVFNWAYAGTKLIRTSAAARVMVAVRFISCLLGAVAP